MDLMEAVLARSRAARIRAERDRFEAARAAAWDAAAARGPHALIMTGATGTTLSSGLSAEDVNGTYDCVPAERRPGGAPVYKRRGQVRDKQLWLYLTSDSNCWVVSTTEEKKDTREGLA